MTETPRRQPSPIKITMRGVYAVGIGLGAAAIWWKFSDQLLARLLPLLGVGL